MRLLRLKLENFRQHENTDVEFGRGMTAIVGPNGSGKTTILEAISFALYGETRGKEDSLRFYWAEGNKYLVRLTFELGGRQFEAERTHIDASLKEVSGNEAKVWATGKRATEAACVKLIGLNHEQFANSFCAEQKSLAFLQFKTNSLRQEEVAKMMGYDRLKAAEALASERKKDFAQRRQVMVGLQPDPVHLQTAKSEALLRLAETAQQSKDLMAIVLEVEKEFGPATAKAKQAEEWQNKDQEMRVIGGNAEGLKVNVSTCTSRVEQLKKELDELASLKPIEVEFKALTERLTSMNSALAEHLKREQLNLQLTERESEKARLQKQIDDLQVPDATIVSAKLASVLEVHVAADKRVKDLAAQWHTDQREATKTTSAAVTEAKNLRKQFERTEELASKGICPECEQPIAKDYGAIVEVKRSEWQLAEAKARQAQEKETRLADKPKGLVEAEVAQLEAQKAHNVAQGAEQEQKSLTSQATLLHKRLEELNRSIEGLKVQRDAISVSFDAKAKAEVESRRLELEPAHRRLIQLSGVPDLAKESEAALAKATKEFEGARARYRELESDRKALPFKTADEAADALSRLRQLEEQKRASEQAAKHLAQLEAIAKKDLATANQRIKDFEAIKKDLAKLEKEEALHAVAGNELKALRLNLNKALGPELEARASENLSLLTNGRYDRLSLDKTFAPSLIENEVVKSVISGGEEDVVALALRLALSELIQERQGHPLSLLILDEVFGSLDAERRQSVLERLSALKGRFEQILVISHIEEINQVADQCLFLSRDSERHATRISDVSPNAAELELVFDQG